MSSFRPARAGGYGSAGAPRRSGPTGGPQQPVSLPADYLKHGYFDASGDIFPELVTGDQVLEVVRKIGQGQGESQLKASQLRRFYGKAKNIEQKLDAGQAFDSVRAELLTLQALAANTVARGIASECFKDFIDRNVALASKDEKHFRKGFLLHFQSVVAYFGYSSRR